MVVVVSIVSIAVHFCVRERGVGEGERKKRKTEELTSVEGRGIGSVETGGDVGFGSRVRMVCAGQIIADYCATAICWCSPPLRTDVDVRPDEGRKQRRSAHEAWSTEGAATAAMAAMAYLHCTTVHT